MIYQKLYEKKAFKAADNQFEPDIDSWDYHYHKIISTLQGTQQQKEAIIRKRILRYFGEFKLQEQSYFSIRNDVDYNTPGLQIIPAKLILYGVDYMSWERMKNYFEGFITNIIRMDDSHFVVEFRNQNECLSAINKFHKGKQMYFSSQDVFKASKFGWIQMKPYHEFIFERKIMARYWTTIDRVDNVSGSTKQSFSKAYSQAKRRFMKSLKQDMQNCQRGLRGRNSSTEREYHRSQSRSRQKNYIYPRNTEIFSGERINQNYRPPRQCVCHRERHAFRSRSRSRSPSVDSNYQKRRCGTLPRLLQEQKIKQADFKFQMYIKKRNNSTASKIDLQPQNRALASVDVNMKSSLLIQKEKTSSTNEQDCEIIGGKKSTRKSNDAHNQSNLQEMNFQLFLERLKLQDTKNDYSAFDIDQMDG